MNEELKMQIKEFAEFTGVTVSTLHYYDDEIGLLTPANLKSIRLKLRENAAKLYH